MKKDVKKSSYYVWFLGAQECKSARDADGIGPVIAALAEREKKVTPHKFTLQVSHRGLKIVHSVSALGSLPGGGGGGKSSSKGDQLVKHLIPDHAVTCVHRDEDLVAVVLLLYNPVTKWPVHVHVYRCDSVETAALLSGQLQTFVDRPENRKRLDETESRLRQSARCGAADPSPPQQQQQQHLPLAERICAGGGKKESPPSSSSESGGVPGHMSTLYDSLAAELKKKLGTGGKTGAPILLPPRDYDTVHRHRGNLNGIDFRRCMSTNIVGVNGTKQDYGRRSGTKMGSSGGSSGIGSDHAPSPEQYEPDNRFTENNSSSDEDWNASPLEEPVFAKPANEYPLPRIRRQDSGVDSGSSPVTLPEKDYYGRVEQQQQANSRRQNREIAQNLREKYSDRNVALVQPRPRNSNCDAVKNSGATPSAAAEFRRKPVDVRQRTPSPSRSVIRESPRERFKDAKEKFLMLEKERIDEQRSALKKCLERQRKENVTPAIRAAVRGSSDWSRSHDSGDETQDRSSRRYNDDDFDDRGLKNVRKTNRSRESLDNDYNGGFPTKHVSNSRRPRNLQQEHDEPRPAPRSYSAEDYLDHDFRPSPPEDRYRSPPRRAAAALQQQHAEAPRAAPRRSNHFNDAPPPPAPSRISDHKRRSTAYAYEDCGDDYCLPPNFVGGGGGRQETPSSTADDDGREYKRRSAAYAYEDQRPQHHHQQQQHHHHHHHQQDAGGYGRRDMAAAADHHRRAADDGAAAAVHVSPVSPRYRHSYAEAYHRHHPQPHRQHSPSPQDHPVYRHNGSLQSSGRIGIAAIHPY